MAYEDFTLLRVEVGGRVCRVTIDNPPINLHPPSRDVVEQRDLLGHQRRRLGRRGWSGPGQPITLEPGCEDLLS
jgi:hypothetical protein